MPERLSFSQTLSSLRLNFVSAHPRRRAASDDWDLPTRSRRLRNRSLSATISSFWSGVNDTRPKVDAPWSARDAARPTKAGAESDVEFICRRPGREPHHRMSEDQRNLGRRREPGLHDPVLICNGCRQLISDILQQPEGVLVTQRQEPAMQVRVVIDRKIAVTPNGEDVADLYNVDLPGEVDRCLIGRHTHLNSVAHDVASKVNVTSSASSTTVPGSISA